MPTQNLVQIQRDLQSLPPGAQTMMYLKRAKDGMVASVPPYLAAAELSSREKMAQREALASGAAPGEQPTVSQQLSQKADLLALQAMKKQAMDRQAADQARTAQMPAPEGAPEPQEQPQPEGGIASLPVEFGFEGGGIVAFNGETGSDVKKPSIYDLERDPLLRRFREWLASREEAPPAPQPEPGSVAAAFPEGSGIRKVAGFLSQRDKDIAAWQAAQKAQQAPQEQQAPQAEAAAGSGRGTMPGRTAADAITFTPGPGQQKPPQQRPPAAPGAQAAAPQQPAALSPQQALEADLMKRLGLTPGTPGLPAVAAMGAPAQDMAGTAADVKAAQAAFGLDKAAGEEERRMIAEMQARYAQQQKDRARMGLKAVLGGFSRGYGGAAAADVAAAQQAYAEDMAHQKSMYDLINAINKGNRSEAEKAFEKTIGLKQEREKETGATSRAELQAKASMYGNLLQAGSSKYNADKHFEAAMAQARMAERRADMAEAKLAIDGLQSAERGIQQELTKLQGAFDKPSRERRAELDANLKAIREQIGRLTGVGTPTAATAPTQGKVVNWADIGKSK